MLTNQALAINPSISQADFREVLEQLYRERTLTPYPAGQAIPLRPDRLSIICRGVVKLFTIQPDGNETMLGLAGPSAPIGFSLTVVDPYWATALTDVDILTLSLAEIESSPVLMAGIFRQLTGRLQQTEAWLAISGKRMVADRLMHLLVQLSREYGQPDGEGVRVTVRLTHSQLASAISTTRVTVTRLLKEFREQGWLGANRRHLIVRPTLRPY